MGRGAMAKLTGVPNGWAETDLFERMEVALKRARMFIEHARYELQPGKATIGDRCPRQDDADDVIAYIDEVTG